MVYGKFWEGHKIVDKSKVEILQKILAFSEYMNFNKEGGNRKNYDHYVILTFGFSGKCPNLIYTLTRFIYNKWVHLF